MRKLLLSMAAALMFSAAAIGQISGTFTIPGATYPTIASAIAAINTSGIGSGGVTFNVTAGYTETLPSITAGRITATGTAANPVVFQKSGAGANPLITAGTPGVGSYDFVFQIAGGDYITFDGISVQENPANTTATTQMEWGFSFLKASATDGAQYNNIKNCVISLAPANTSGYAIYLNNYAYTAPGTSLTITSVAGTNSYNKINGNTITGVNGGVYIYGYADGTSPYTYYDQGNEIGKTTANTFNNYGGAATTAYGIYGYYQNNFWIANNSFTGTVTATNTGLAAIYLGTGNNANLDIYNNTITLTYNGTGTFYGIYSTMAGSGTSNTTNIYGNTITGCSQPGATSGTCYYFYSYGGMIANFYNNTVSSNSYGTGTTTATGSIYYMYCYSSPTSAGTMNVYGCTIQNNSRVQSAVSSGTGYHFYLSGGNGTMNAYNNIVNNQTVGSTSTQYIVYVLHSGAKNFYNNSITNILNGNGGTWYGLYNGNGTGNAIFYNNKWQNLVNNGTTSIIYGIYQSSGANVYYYNNFVSELKTPTSGSAPAIAGMYLSSATAIGAYNNTIYLNASSTGGAFATAGIYASSTPPMDLRNNLVVNVSTPGATGRTVAHWRTSSTLTTYAATSNNNDWYAGTPGASNLIYYDGTNSDQTLAAYKARVSPKESVAITENPPFVNVATTPYNLHLQTAIATQCESGASVVATPVPITTDYDANPRYPNPGYPNNPLSPATAPDIGADEFGGLLLDLTPPNVQFTTLTNTSSTSARLLITTITDQTGVPTSGLGLPRLYWKINSGSWNAVTATYVSGSTYTFTFGAGVVLNDIVSYYIVAQDLVTPTANVGATPSGGATGFTLSPPACSTPPTTPFTYTIVGSLSGVYPVGVGQTYPTITAAVADLNLKEVVGPVTFELWDATYSASETFPLIINAYAGASAVNTVKFKPKSGVTSTVTGSSTTGILVLYGCQYITLDGSNSGGTDKSLTWENTSTTAMSYTIGVFNNGTVGASNCTIKNCNIKASPQVTNSTYAVILNAAGGGYNNIVINNNSIFSARYGMQYAGVSGFPATNGQITNNIFGTNVDATALQYIGILVSQADNTLIQGNEIMGAPAGNTNTYQSGIYLIGGSTNTIMKNNKIHDWYYTGTSGYGCFGIYYYAEATSVTEISNNLIYAIKSDGDPSGQYYDPAGIFVRTGGNCKIYHNNINMTGSTLSSSYLSYSSCISVYTGITALDIRNNILKNSMQPVSGTGNSTYAIYSASANTAFTTINYNDYFVDGINPNIGYLGANQATLAAWRTATGQDVNSINNDPSFVSATDLHPSATAIQKAGTYLSSVPTDYAGTNRTAPPDMGAYQMSSNTFTVTSAAATGITTTTATINGNITANNNTVTSGFNWGLTTAYGNNVAGTPATVTGNTSTGVAYNLTGLTPLTTYHFRINGVSGAVSGNGTDIAFTTLAPPPTVVTTAATGVSGTGATMNGTVNANGASTTVTFDYGLTTAYGTTVAGTPGTVTGSSVTNVSAALTGLLPGTTYHYQVRGVSSGGDVTGGDLTFTTAALAPTVVTNAATGISTSGATLNGTVTANGASTTCSFEYGLTTAYGSTIAATPGTVTGNTATSISATLSGLATNTLYHFRAKGVNSVGTTYGSDLTFTTSCTSAGPAGPVTGPVTACQGGTGYVYTVAPILNAIGYNWTLPVGGTITAGANTNTITVSYGANAVPGYVMVYGLGLCGNGSPSQLLVTVNAAPTPTISGPASACAGATGKVYTTEPGMTGYTWAVTGGTITAGAGTNSVTVTWTTAGAQTISVNYNNAAGCPAINATTYNVAVNALPVPTIAGAATICQGLTTTYTTQTGQASYVWTVSAGGQITSGQGTASVNVKWNTAGAQSVAVNYANSNGCTAAAPVSYPVTVNTAPVPTITGTTSLCATSGYYTYTTEAGMTAYNWTVSAGGSIFAGQGTNTLTVYWSTAGSQSVSVVYNNAGGCGPVTPTVLPVTVNTTPGAAGAITGPSSVCAGQQGVAYSCAPVAGAAAYAWTLPAGATIAGGANTNSITVNFAANASSGAITVSANNLCGNGPASPALNVTVNSLPAAAGAITGSNQVCANSQGVAYSVATIANATGYNWTLPTGATIASGANTNSITVNFGATGGVISVYGTNTCGVGTASPNYSVTVNPKPATPTITQSGYVLTSSATSGNQWYKDGNAISGATAQTYTVPATEPGYYWVKVTLLGCTSDESNRIYIQGVGIGEASAGSFSIFPVPNDGHFTATISWPSAAVFSISVYNELGQQMFRKTDIQVNGTQDVSIDIRPAPAGVYTVVFTSADNKVVRKVIVNK